MPTENNMYDQNNIYNHVTCNTHSNINIVYSENPGELISKDHFHNSHEIIYVVEGTVSFRINNATYDVQPNTLIFISHLETHELKATSFPYKRYFILIPPDYFNTIITQPEIASIFNNRPSNFSHIIKLSRDEQEDIFRIISHMYSEINKLDKFYELNLKAYFYLMMVYLYRKYTDAFPLSSIDNLAKTITEIQKYISVHYQEPINLKEIAEKYYISMYHLSHSFKKITGYTFRDYLILQRIAHAKDLLYNTDKNVAEICAESGFNNLNNFIRTFKKHTSFSPLQYRKNLRDRI